MRGACGIGLAARRLLCTACALFALSLFTSGPALAQSLGSVTAAVQQATAPAAQTVQQAVPTAQQATAPVTQATTPVVQQATAPIAQTTAPVVQHVAPVVQQAVAPVTRGVTPVVQQVVPIVQQATAPVNEAAPPLVQAVAPLMEQVTGAVATTSVPVASAAAPVTDAGTPQPTPQPQVEVTNSSTQTAGAPTTAEFATAPAQPAIDSTALRPARLTAAPVEPRRLVANLPATSGIEHARVAAADSRKDGGSAVPGLPGLPGVPPVPGSSFAPPSGGSAPLFVAALVAAFLLAAPGLSRRLRLNLAPWPLPIALPSLERPG